MSQRLERLKKISRLMDSQFEGPLGWKFGLDPLIGLIPFLGDALTSLISFYIVAEAYAMGCGFSVLLRMLFHIILEGLIKAIPGLGLLFDFYWKSNLKNIELLERHVQSPQQTQRSSLFFLVAIGFIFLASMVAVLSLSIWFLAWLVQLF